MPDYFYHAVDRNGHAADGSMAADSEQSLERKLKEIGYWLIEAQIQTTKKHSQRLKVPRRELIDYFNEMCALLTAGIPIAGAVLALSEETEHKALKHILEDVAVNVQAGNEVSDCFRKYPQVFSEQICNLIEAGEQGGNLTSTFRDLSDHMEWVDKIVADIKQASIYPTMIITAVFGLVGVLFIFVVPTFSALFEELGLELPPLTQAVVSIGHFAQRFWWLVLICLGALIMGMKTLKKSSSAAKYQIDKYKLSMPIFGKIITMLVQSQLVHNLALMLRAGVPIIEALKLCQGLTDNAVMDNAVKEAEDAVRQGNKISEAFRSHDVISSLTLRMIVVGEDSGQLDTTLQQVAERFDEEIPRQLKRVFAIVEPLITLILVVIVGLIAAAVFLPMFSLMSGVGV